MDLHILLILLLGALGAAMGSFAAATVWRLRARQLEADRLAEEPYDKAEYKRLKALLHRSVADDRSQCLRCGHRLRWFELLPIVSWLAQAGRCRSCHRPIGAFELLMELGVAAYFVVSYLVLMPAGPLVSSDTAQFIVWLVIGVVGAILFAYDIKWYLLPDRLTAGLIVLGVVFTALEAVRTQLPVEVMYQAAGSMAILAGTYGLLYLVSRGRWVGFGDVKLAIGLGIILGNWQLAILALFLANLIGCLVVLPLLASKRLATTSRVPFGPFFLAGSLVAGLFGPSLIHAYLSFLGLA